ncbi:MAG: TraR/DksA family transcriptional regulator [Candidatus Dadabacteria bacterium]|nr:MAG: TraR/DksA family transcriptional regulator [Candidatus Dadabacteria bacterium]
MKPEQLERWKEKLLALRDELAGEVQELREEGFSLGTDAVQDVGDDAANTYNRQVLLNLSERERERLRQIEEALERIADGSFGRCEDCGELIPEARLEAVPWATLCVECKALREKEGNPAG